MLPTLFHQEPGFPYAGHTDWAEKVLMPGAVVTSGGLLGFEHKVFIAGNSESGCEVDALEWRNVILGNLKNALSGTHHDFTFHKYSHRDLAEDQYGFYRCFGFGTMINRLASALMQANPCSERKFRCRLRYGNNQENQSVRNMSANSASGKTTSGWRG